jgi:hypothetical protein
MRVIHVHARLRLAAFSLFAAIPLAAISVLLSRNASLWRMPVVELAYVCGFAALSVLILGWRIVRGGQFAFLLVGSAGTLWVLGSLVSAIRFHNVVMAVFSIVLAALFTVWIAWTRHEFGRSFFDPRMKWFQGLPKPIPGLECELTSEQGTAKVRVSRIDREGAFLYSDAASMPERFDQITFLFRDRRISCAGIPVRILDRVRERSGVGIQFRNMSPDSRKTLGDFVESLKGEGYV